MGQRATLWGILIETSRGLVRAAGGRGPRVGEGLLPRRTSSRGQSLLTGVGPGRRAHAKVGEEIESEAAARWSGWTPPNASWLPWSRFVREARADPPSWPGSRGSGSLPGGVFSTLRSRSRLLGLLPFRRLCSRPARPAVGTRNNSRCSASPSAGATPCRARSGAAPGRPCRLCSHRGLPPPPP